VIAETDANTGMTAGVTWMILLTGSSALPHASVAVQVSVMLPPQAPGIALNVDVLDVPLSRQPDGKPLV
jgi:hypothetical protein